MIGRFDWERLIDDPKRVTLTVYQYAALCALAHHADNRTGVARVGVEELADESRTSVTTVRRALAVAQRDGLLRRDRRGHRTWRGAAATQWRLLDPAADAYSGSPG